MKRNTDNDRASVFVQKLADFHFDSVFNPYADICPDHDMPDAAMIRRHNLESVLRAALNKKIESIWIARDLGYRGGRRTGLALTDEAHLATHAELLGTGPLSRATTGLEVKERTATVVWETIRAINQPVFLWNIFPFHPHEPFDSMSNRSHTRAERLACRPILIWLIEALQPRNIVTIGRDAYLALEDIGIRSANVRHPSYGGQNEFIAGLHNLYGLAMQPRPSQTILPLTATYAAGRRVARA